MKAIVKSYAEPGLWMQSRPRPSFSENEVLIKIIQSGICGTDLHIYAWDDWAQRNIKVPRTIGHEFVGEIVAMGESVEGFEVGERISAEGHICCGVCHNCRVGKAHLCQHAVGIGSRVDGAFAEYLAMPQSNLWKLDASIPMSLGAIMDPLGNAVHSVLSFDLVGQDVLINGAGPIGIMTATICRFVGARHVVITDINPYRLKLATKMGVSAAINTRSHSLDEAIERLKIKRGFSIGFEMSGHPQAFNSLLDALEHGAKIGLLGFLPPSTQIDWDQFIFKGLQLKGIYGREIFKTWYQMEHLLQSGLAIEPIITHTYAAEDFQAAFETVQNGECGKVVLDWS